MTTLPDKRGIAIGLAFAVVVYVLMVIYTNRRPAGVVESRKADTNDVARKPVSVGRESAGLTSAITTLPPWPQPDIDEREVAGIGAALVRPNAANGVVQIERVLPDSPAERAGLRSGMNIHKVDGIPILRLPLSETTRIIRGPVGTTVRLEVYEGLHGEKFTVELTREKLGL